MNLYVFLSLVYPHNIVEIYVNGSCLYHGEARFCSVDSCIGFKVIYVQSAFNLDRSTLDLLDLTESKLQKCTELFIECDFDPESIKS